MSIHRLSAAKLLELVITLTCVGLHYNSLGGTAPNTSLLVSGTFVGFSIILIALFAGYMMGTPINKNLDMFFSLIGTVMFVASGALVIQAWENSFSSESRRMAMAKGSLAIINGIIFLFDILLTYKE